MTTKKPGKKQKENYKNKKQQKITKNLNLKNK